MLYTLRWWLFIALPLLMPLDMVAQTIRYVRPSPAGLSNGSSWLNASGSLQAMLNASQSGDQVWVMAGLYKPTGDLDRSISFTLKNGVAVYGGFQGQETTLSQRPVVDLSSPSSTTLSGDIGQVGDLSDNSYHVVATNQLDNTAVFNGFVLTGGNANGNGFESTGGGLFNEGSSPTIINCTFVNNAGTYGAGLFNYGSSPVLTSCRFSSNTATYGGGMHNDTSTPVVTNCWFSNNTARDGGGINNMNSSSARLINCRLDSNRASGWGGGISNTLSGPILTNCTISGNTAPSGGGGGIYSYRSSSPQVQNCILWNNGGANTLAIYRDARINISYSLLESGATGYTGGDGNLIATTSPFISNTNLQLRAGSQAINAGSNPAYGAVAGPATDLAGNPRIQYGLIDIGAYESAFSCDLTPILYARPTTVSRTQQVTVVVNLVELNAVATHTSFTVRITKDDNVTLSFPASATSVGGTTVQNSAWSFDDADPTYYLLTTSQRVEAGGQLSLGLTGMLLAAGTSGSLTISTTVAGSNGEELKQTNNTDADKIDYFQP